MSGIVLQCRAEKILNKGGGHKSRTTKLGNGMMQNHIGPKEKGTDYVVFKCPAPDCGKRNKKSMYEVKGRAGEALSLKCYSCRREIEVTPPKTTRIILNPNSPALGSGLVGADGRPI